MRYHCACEREVLRLLSHLSLRRVAPERWADRARRWRGDERHGDPYMPTTPSPPDPIHFRSLQLENVRAFGSRQSLEFVDDNGAVSHWNLILGENGVGKTTLMQALAGMRPIPGVKEDSEAEESPQAGPPTLSTAELSVHENDDLMRFIRTGGPSTATMVAVLEADGATLKTRVEIKGTTNELESAEFGTAPH